MQQQLEQQFRCRVRRAATFQIYLRFDTDDPGIERGVSAQPAKKKKASGRVFRVPRVRLWHGASTVEAWLGRAGATKVTPDPGSTRWREGERGKVGLLWRGWLAGLAFCGVGLWLGWS